MTNDWFSRTFGAAIDDVRKKLIEEPWFGRAVTPPHRNHSSLSQEMGWDQPPSEVAPPAQDHGHDFDR